MIDKRLMRLPGIKQLLTMLAGLTVLQAFVILLQATFLSRALVNSWEQKSLNTIILPTTLFFVVFLIRHLTTLIKRRYLHVHAQKIADDLRSSLLDKIYTTGPKMIGKRGTGNLVTTALDGMDEAENYINLVLEKMMNMSIIPPVLLVYVYFQDIKSGIILTILVPLIILFMIILGYAAQDKADRQYAQYTVLSNHFLDSLRGLPTLKMLGLSKRYTKNIYKVSEDYRKSTISTLRVAILSTFALDWITTLSIAILAVFLGLGLINGNITLYPALISLILAPEYFLPLRDFSNDYHATLDGKNAMNNLLNILEVPDNEDNNELPAISWEISSTVKVQNLNFNYDDTQPDADLHDVNFELSGFNKIGVIGESGSGKTTLINLLGGFLNSSSGQNITVNNHQIPNFAQKNWQKLFSYIPQKPYLFSGTIKDNIVFYKPEASLEEINSAVATANLTSFIDSLPNGLDTVVGEGGRGISGGQAQRIMIARAVLDNSRKIILLDEPTAHLDIETEYELKKTFNQAFKDHLVVFATHRLHWINEMDYVLVMKDGAIVEQGTPDDLTASNGYYVQLINQMRGENL
ncbi:thiol reductant ABC exporter subunit CydD [Companilactobacillus sp. RD055328]|uniref:thiol reductant ABC exporter subunit CydD n=1 Tax=Companilactobacillus sp. RD055328 TaxID=2916634 RepID=UPI001FC861CC|nr:thiol reductant ABC exporter subunit CydD [Companilactobacillus sp. RD055328]GKQ43423.1 thiol reductant ABC exporter subunit CydD [Companilactobacillus sp. RD055328]